MQNIFGPLDQSFWYNKNVFITGHTGFKGSWLALWLQKLGANVFGYALEPDTRPNMYTLSKVGFGIESTIGDIMDFQKLHKSLCQARPEIVFHLAAQPLVLEGYASPRNTYLTNIMGTVNLFESIRKIPTVRSVINITSDKCYENTNDLSIFSEDDPLGGNDPYSSSKASSEIITKSYRRSFFDKKKVGVATARSGNVIGGGDWGANRLVPDALSAFRSKVPLVIRNATHVRPWQHVLDPLRGYLLLAQSLFISREQFNGAWNFGPSDEGNLTVLDIVKILSQQWGQSASWVIDESDSQHEEKFLGLNAHKAEVRLGWQTALTAESACTYIVDWYQNFVEGNDLHGFSLRQIDEYVSHIKKQSKENISS